MLAQLIAELATRGTALFVQRTAVDGAEADGAETNWAWSGCPEGAFWRCG
jgi:hypothetical protein